MPAATPWTGEAATYAQRGRSLSSPGWNTASGLRRRSGRCLFSLAERHLQQDFAALPEDIREQGRRLRDADLEHAAVPGLPRPDPEVGPVLPASRKSAAAAAADGVAAAVAAGDLTEVDLIHDLEVNAGRCETTDGETSTDEGYAARWLRRRDPKAGLPRKARETRKGQPPHWSAT